MSPFLPYAGHLPQVASSAFVAPTASLIGQVLIEEQASVWYGAVLRGDVGKIRIGKRSNIQDNACLHMTYQQSDAEIGASVIVGHNAVIHGAIVEDDALIGMGAIVMDNAQVERGAWVAAGSVVPPRARLRSGWLYRGNPAREARPVKSTEAAWAEEAIERYVSLAAEHRKQIVAP